jgi:fructose-bisphosphate aldolase class II
MLVNLNEVLPQARAGRYAVGLFNTVNLEMAKGVLQAAEELRSPVIIGTAEVLLPYAGLEELSWLLRPMAQKASVPVVLHFDHGLTPSLVQKAMELGFSSVMYDCSTLPFEENCAAVARMTRLAHQKGVTVEAELGHVGANNSAVEGGGDQSIYTEVDEARAFYEATGVDALAVAIGTAHGAYRSRPRLDFERLKELAAAVPAPLVLHGGSGLSEQDFRSAVAGGIAKVNIFTDLNCAAAAAAAKDYAAGVGMTDRMPDIVAAVKNATMEKMRIFGSDGKA